MPTLKIITKNQLIIYIIFNQLKMILGLILK